MFDLFGLKAKKKAKREAEEAERLKLAQERKKKYQERKALIDKFLKDDYHKRYEIERENFIKRKEKADFLNSRCPICLSKNVINSIVRTKGEIHGEGSIDGSGFHYGGLFGSYGSSYLHGHSKLDGDLDTLPVNKCKDCGHEWNVEEAHWQNETDYFDENSSGPGYLYRRVENYYKLSYNPYDVTEECNSLEEKKEKFINDTKDVWILRNYKNIPKYMIDYVMYKGMKRSHWYYDDIPGYFQCKKNMDAYSYVIPDDVWEIVKLLIGWKGEENG